MVGRLGEFADRLGQVNDVAECAYQTDRLAVRIVQSRDNAWAVGVVAVVRGRLGAIADVAACYLLNQIPLIGLGLRGIAPEQDSPSLCFDSTGNRHGGEDYTVVWLGSSTLICQMLQDQLVPGDGQLAAVRAGGKDAVAMRSGPSTNDSTVRQIPDGTIGRAVCRTTDDWIRVELAGDTGYLPPDQLDTALPSNLLHA